MLPDVPVRGKHRLDSLRVNQVAGANASLANSGT